MGNTLLKTILLFLFGFCLTGIKAQESINTGGGNISGSGGTISYSLGQNASNTFKGTNGLITEGVQQPYEISVVTAEENTGDIHLSVTAYPNPVNDFLILSIDAPDFLYFSFQLFDIDGKVLQSTNITNKNTRIAMGNLTPAIYFIKIIQRDKEIKIFKRIKK